MGNANGTCRRRRGSRHSSSNGRGSDSGAGRGTVCRTCNCCNIKMTSMLRLPLQTSNGRQQPHGCSCTNFYYDHYQLIVNANPDDCGGTCRRRRGSRRSASSGRGNDNGTGRGTICRTPGSGISCRR